MVDDNISSSSSLQGTTVRTQTSTVTTLPSPSLAHQLSLKLTSSNFLLWKTQFLPMVRGCGLGHHIDGSQVIPGQFLFDDQPNPNYHVWVRADQLVLSWIVASVSEGILPQLVGTETAQTAWNKLVAAYASGSRPQIRELKTQLHTLQRDNTSIESYVQRAKGIADKLAALQHPVTNDDLVKFVLTGLGPAYRPFTRSLESRQEDISFDALYGLLLNEERQLKRDETLNVIAPTALYTQSSYPPGHGRGRGRGNRGRGRFQNHGFSQMPQQRGKGHIARVCPSPKTSNGTRVSQQPVSNLANTQHSPTQNWLMDSVTTHHLTSDLDNLGIHSEYQGPEEDLVTRVPLHKRWTNRGLYSLPVTKLSSPSSFTTSLGVWHARLAHASYPTVRQALPSTVFQSSKSHSLCTTCGDALVHMKSTNPPTDPLTLHIPLSPTIPPSPNQSLTLPITELPVFQPSQLPDVVVQPPSSMVTPMSPQPELPNSPPARHMVTRA
ncbi:hypothetical protein KY285_030696 [Solanum tuberosum]|nr:hypothetical protein KY284_030518 [Solanum tuberosum]KAH0655814.1 hypothetical protein KY285_030696 [Solanum tuberosum]